MDHLTESLRYWKISGVSVKEIERLSLINVNLKNECIEQLFDAMQFNKALKVKQLILNKNDFDIVGMKRICKYIAQNNCHHLQYLEILNCKRLDFNQSDYPIFIFLTIMCCIKRFEVVLFDDEHKKEKKKNYLMTK
eukprot:TRINITY_DN21595_c0_g1_i1.p1 TRINITY_DN21595_c0_g1~~TRINITY_DN21595_c0_g1_i1.p1  ORF type:complete len:136 (-),score=14.95 TRINITY_DN21595_c0_g1_i1:273-680(-)